jgi:hypothetical protein
VSFFDESPKPYDWEAEKALAPNDPILHEMASELRVALQAVGKDPATPPDKPAPPTTRAYTEYLRRGGKVFGNAEAFASALVDEVVRQAA